MFIEPKKLHDCKAKVLIPQPRQANFPKFKNSDMSMPQIGRIYNTDQDDFISKNVL